MTGTEDGTGAVDLSWDADTTGETKSYVVHASPVNESDPHKAIFMYYTESPNYRFTPSNLQPHQPGDILRYWVQAFDEVGVGANETEKAEYLNVNKYGSEWSAVVEMTMKK